MISIKHSEFIELSSFLKNNYGINLFHKKNLIEGRLNSLLVQKGFTNFREYIDHIYKDKTKNELTTLINKLTTNHTYFMRESEHFQFFKNTVLPYLHQNVKDKDLRIWSAGCSSGEEAYTLAMIMEDYFSKEKGQWDKKILASDISVNVLQRAEKGIYEKESLGNISQSWKLNYFNDIGNNTYKINSEIQKEVIFRVFNLMDDFPFKKKFHAIFCRNVMIYFDQETKNKLIKKFYDMTEEGGYLFIGLSEAINRNESPYKCVATSVYRKI
jgi:chemotaxis protein methyltransferase CheR